jgi:hypothetical protein
MSLLNTKPRYCPNAVATQSGWTDPVTGELLVSVGNLKNKLALEQPKLVIEEKIIMQPEVKTRKPYAPRKPKVIGEVTESKLPAGTQLLGEVVEYDLEKPVIGE